jgi:hypothetical protein
VDARAVEVAGVGAVVVLGVVEEGDVTAVTVVAAAGAGTKSLADIHRL